jgi:hypothetical protein
MRHADRELNGKETVNMFRGNELYGTYYWDVFIASHPADNNMITLVYAAGGNALPPWNYIVRCVKNLFIQRAKGAQLALTYPGKTDDTLQL